MIKFIAKRILFIIPVMLGVLTIAFLLSAATPSDPVTSILGTGASEEAKQQLAAELGLDDPGIVRYGKYVFNFFTKLDMGISYETREPVRSEVLQRFPTTAILSFGSIILAVLIGLPLGIISAVKQYSWVDNLAMGCSMFFVSVPSFWLSLMLILAFAVKLKWLPPTGITNPLGWVLPIIVVGLGAAASIARVTRSSMLEAIRQDYVDTARSKGINEKKVVWSHCIRNALIPIVTAIGNQVGVSFGGALAIESVFGIPGIGSYLVSAVHLRNYTAIMGGVVFLALVFSLINLIVDIMYVYIDPRLKESLKAASLTKKSIRQMRRASKLVG